MEQKYDTIGARLRQARTAKGLSIPDVYEKTGISRGNLSTLETDKSKPSAEALIVFSELYGVTTDWILKGEGVDPQFLAKEKDGISYDIDHLPKVPNKELTNFFNWIAHEWEKGDEVTRGWIIGQFRRAFPEFKDHAKK